MSSHNMISNAVLTSAEHASFALKIENLLERQTPEDILCILSTVADNAIHLVKGKLERRRMGVLFIKQLQLLALEHNLSEEAEGDRAQYQRHDAGLRIVSRDGETVNAVDAEEEWDETDSLLIGLIDFCAEYGYQSILGAVPGAVGAILRDFLKECDRDEIILETISASAAHRSEVKSQATKKAMLDLSTRLKPVTKSIEPIRDSRVRNAVILEMVDALTSLAHM